MVPQQQDSVTPSGNPHMGEVIKSELPMTRFGFGNGREPLRAGMTAVYCTANATPYWVGRPLYIGECALKGYRTRYDVWIRDYEHEFDIANELPGKDDVFRFYARVQFGFRVHDAAEVVRRQIKDGFTIAQWRLLQTMRDISRKYRTEQCAEANQEINNLLGRKPTVYDEGITVYRFAAFLSLDDQTQEALRRERAKDHEILLAQKTNELEQLKAKHQRELELARIEAVRHAMQGDHGLLLLHMARHPDDTEGVLTMMAQSHDRNREAQVELFKSMLDNNLLQNIDVQDIRDENLRQVLLAARADPLRPLRIGADVAPPREEPTEYQFVIPAPPSPPNGHDPAGRHED